MENICPANIVFYSMLWPFNPQPPTMHVDMIAMSSKSATQHHRFAVVFTLATVTTAFLPVCLVHCILMCGVRLPRNPLMMMAMIKWGAGVQWGLLVPVAAALA